MNKSLIAVATLGLFFASVAAAQQPGHQNMPMPMPMPPAAQQPAPGACGADDAKPGMSKTGMQMSCGGCSMMRGMTASASSGTMTPAPTESAKMIQLRGEMMRAMGEVMLKYGKLMEGQ